MLVVYNVTTHCKEITDALKEVEKVRKIFYETFPTAAKGVWLPKDFISLETKSLDEHDTGSLEEALAKPITLFKVKTGFMSAERAFDVVNAVRDMYENSSKGEEVTETKIFVPDSLIDVQVFK